MKKTLLLIGAAILTLGSVEAQQIPLYSNYFFAPYLYNPAQSGSEGVTEATVMHRRQWTGMEGAPETSAITLNGALNREKIGYSVYAYSDQTDIVKRVGAYGAYAYHVRLSQSNTLSFGLAAGYLSNTIDTESARVEDELDPLLYPNLSRGNFDLNFGINLRISNFQIGAAVPQLLGAPIEYSNNYDGPVEYSLIRHFVFNAQYDFEVQGSKRVLSPLVMVRTAPMVPTQIDAGAIFNMTDYGYIGAMFRSDYAITGNIGVHLNDQLSVGYAYDFSTNTHASALGLSHEFMLRYRFGSNKDNERLESEIRRLKDQQRRQAEENEEYVRERLEEFKDEFEAGEGMNRDEVEKIIEEKLDGMTLQQPGRPTGTQQQQRDTRQQQSDFDPNEGQQQQTGRDQTGGVTGYSRENYASNVQPGSPGYYVTAGVFGSENNARRHMQNLSNQGLDVNMFRDKVNGMYYVYLLKFDSYGAADRARASKLNEQYDGRLWVKIVE